VLLVGNEWPTSYVYWPIVSDPPSSHLYPPCQMTRASVDGIPEQVALFENPGPITLVDRKRLDLPIFCSSGKYLSM
jgi:hypothetical protein